MPTAGGANKAVLVLTTAPEALDPDGGPGYPLGDFPTLPGSRVTLRLPDGTTIPSSVTPDPDASGALGAIYYFSVAASFSAGQVVVDPGVGVEDVPTQTQVTFAGPINFPASFPPPPSAAERTGPVPAGLAPSPQSQPSRLGQTSPPSRTAPEPGGVSSLVIGLIVGLGLLAALVFLAVLVRTERRRWGFAAKPVRTVVPYTTALLPALAP